MRTLTTDESPCSTVNGFSPEEIGRFERDGFLIVRQAVSAAACDAMARRAREDLERYVGPVEHEADVNYPGSPESLDSPGGRTVRRLKNALVRGPMFFDWVAQPDLQSRLTQLLKAVPVCPLAHHNCIMTKQPRFSSETGWHQDFRFWAFEKPELVSVWLALGDERSDNGALDVIPGSHRMSFAKDCFDEGVFFRTDHAENQRLLESAQAVELNAGDLLFFHCRTLHSAGRNLTDETKFSVVFTFRGADNPPLPGSRSASMPELLLSRGN